MSRATYPGTPGYGGIRTWVESSQACDPHTLAEASVPLDYKEYAQYKLQFYQNNTVAKH